MTSSSPRPSRAVDDAYERLREKIFSGELQPNERLVYHCEAGTQPAPAAVGKP